MLVGFALTEVGAALVGASIGFLAADKGRWSGTPALFAVGGLTAAVGIPLWATGQAKKGPRAPAVRPDPPPVTPPPDSGTALRAAGITLTLAGVAGIIGGLAGLTLSGPGSEFDYGNQFAGVIALGAGSVVAGVGIPLWIVGQNKVSAANAASAASQPSWALRAGGTGLWLEGRY